MAGITTAELHPTISYSRNKFTYIRVALVGVAEICIDEDIMLVGVAELIDAILMGVDEVCKVDGVKLAGEAKICVVDDVVLVGMAKSICAIVGAVEVCTVDLPLLGVADTCFSGNDETLMGVVEISAADEVDVAEVCTVDGVILMDAGEISTERIKGLHCYSTGRCV